MEYDFCEEDILKEIVEQRVKTPAEGSQMLIII